MVKPLLPSIPLSMNGSKSSGRPVARVTMMACYIFHTLVDKTIFLRFEPTRNQPFLSAIENQDFE